VEEGFVTDADIDSILAMGEKKTKDLQSAINAKIGIGADGGTGLLDFKIDSTSFQTFEGVDYRDAAERRGQLEKAARDIRLAIAQSSAEAMGDRAAKRTVLSYNEQAVLKALGEEAAGGSGGGGGASAKSRESKEAARLRALLPPSHRPPRLEPWHFCDRRRIQEITAMEIAHVVEARERAKAGGSGGSGSGSGSSGSGAGASAGGAGASGASGASAAASEAAEDGRAAAAAGAAGAVTAEEGAAPADAAAPASSAAAEPQAPQASQQQQAQQPAGPFPQELIEERQALLDAGFPHWKRADFDAFVAANAR
jgi:hypothetical protein